MNKNITMLIISFLIVAVIGVMQQSTSYEQSNFGDTVVFYPQLFGLVVQFSRP